MRQRAPLVGWSVACVLAACTEYRLGYGVSDIADSRYCLYCHGGAGEMTAFRDTTGREGVNHRGVGAHQAHVGDPLLSEPIGCETCHVVPIRADDPGHMDSALPAEVVFSGLARASGAEPVVWTLDSDGATDIESASVRCSNVYCHGATLAGGRATSPLWNGPPKVLADFSSCDACHGLPPPNGRHSSAFEQHGFMGTNCSYCHQGVVEATTPRIAEPKRHVNGRLDVTLSSGTWEPATRTCSPACHGPETW